MKKAAAYWSNDRLDDLAAAIEPLPARVAVLEAIVEHLADDNRVLRAEIATIERALLQMGWMLVAALLGGAGALLAALI